MYIHRLNAEDRELSEKWNDFVYSCPDASFFHRSNWQKIIKKVFNHETFYLFAEENGVINGVLPMAKVDSLLFGKSLVSLPFSVYGGIAALNNSAFIALENEAKKLALSLKVDWMEFRGQKKRNEFLPTQDLYVNFKKDIFCDSEKNMQQIPRKQRAMVRKGINNGLTSVIDSEVKQFFALYADNVHRHGTPALPKRYFDVLCDEFKEDCQIMTVLDKSNNPISSVLSFYFKDEVLPYYAGDSLSARCLSANDFKYWELLRKSGERGIKIFNFGRSKINTGSFNFKKNWGFDPEKLNYQYYLYSSNSIPQNNPSNKKFSYFIKIWKMLPLAFANRLGPHIVKNLS